MSTTVHHVSLLTPRAAPQNPRGARVAAEFFAGAVNALTYLFTPVPQAAKSRSEEAAAVRELAWRVRQSDPGFSADLYAAAARHEGLDD